MTAPRQYLNDWDRNRDMLSATPRQRVSMNRNNPLTLTGDWQIVPFTFGASSFDSNSFPTNRFDTTNFLVLANPSTSFEQAYSLSMDYGIAINDANTAVKLSVRFVVPRPSGNGGPIYFPLPESLGRVDLPDQVVSPNGAVHFEYEVYSGATVRAYGAQVQIKATSYRLNGTGLVGNVVSPLVTALTGTSRPQLTDAVMNMYAI